MDCDTIYHYCSLSTFLTIIDKKTLRLSNVLKSNDYLERKYVLLQCEDLIVDQILYQIEKTGYPCNETQRRYYDLVMRKTLSDTIRFFDDYSTVSHVMCFSRNKDLLSQWCGYADDGKGVAIGFSRKALERFLGNRQHIDLVDVFYGTPTAVLEERTASIVKKYFQISRKYDQNLFQIEGHMKNVCEALVCHYFLNDGLKYKKSDFREEEEVRLMLRVPPQEFGELTQESNETFIDRLQSDINPLRVIYDFIPKGNKVVSYYDIYFGGKEIDPCITHEFIKEIVIGPKADISIPEMAHILRSKKGLNIVAQNITKSGASYR